MIRWRWAAASVVLLLAAVTGHPPQEGREETPSPEPPSLLGLLDALPSVLDPSELPQLTAQRLRNDAIGVQARMAYLPGRGEDAAPFNSRVDAIVRSAIAERTGSYRPAVGSRDAGLSDRGCVAGSTLLAVEEVLAEPRLSPPSGTGTTVLCDIVAAQGDFFGQRFRILRTPAGEIVSDELIVVYTDTATGEVVTAAELWREDAALALHDSVVDAVRR